MWDSVHCGLLLTVELVEKEMQSKNVYLAMAMESKLVYYLLALVWFSKFKEFVLIVRVKVNMLLWWLIKGVAANRENL